MLGRIITGLTIAIAALAVWVPFASAGNGIVDDSWRSASVKATPGVSTRLVDDYWRDSLRAVKVTPGVANRIVDDYFRNAQPSVTATPADRIVDDYFRNAQPVVQLTPGVANRIVDDSFRDAPAAVATGNGFNWGDFGIGAAVAVGAMLMLAGLGAGLLAARQNRKTGSAATV
jgi:hypothetical protein